MQLWVDLPNINDTVYMLRHQRVKFMTLLQTGLRSQEFKISGWNYWKNKSTGLDMYSKVWSELSVCLKIQDVLLTNIYLYTVVLAKCCNFHKGEQKTEHI